MPGASSNQPCLTVLGGSMSGTDFVLEDAVDNILIGSEASCKFCLPLPGVSPIHARIWIDASGVTIYDTNSPRGLYVNDDRVSGQAPLRNGDILWLGTPGEEDVVMIQCRLPARPALPATAGPAAAPAVGAEPVVEASPEPMVEVETEPEPFGGATEVLEIVPDEPPATDETAFLPPPPAPVPAPGDEFALSEDPLFQATSTPTLVSEAEREPVKFSVDLPSPGTTPAAPAPFFEDEIEATVADMPAPALPAPPAPVPPPAPPRAPEAPTVVMPPPARVEPPRPAPRAPATPAPRPTPAPPAAAPPAPAARQRPAAPAARPARAAPRAERAAPASRAPSPAPVAPPTPRAKSSSTTYAALGGAVLLLGAAGFLAMRFLNPAQPSPPPTVAAITQPPATLPPPTAPPETVEAAPEPPVTVPPVEEEVTVVKSPPPSPKATPSVPAVPAKSPPPAASPGKASPSPAAKPTAPGAKPAEAPAEAARAQQVAAQVGNLLGQADAAAAGQRHDAAIGLYDEVLKLDPQNARATAGKASAQAAAAAGRRAFVTGRTVVQTAKADKADLSGFETSDVKVAKAPDFLGRIEFEVTPPKVKAGDSYTLRIYIVNEGKKPIKISAMTVTTKVNGEASGGPRATQVKEVQPQQRTPLDELPGVWKEGVNSWVTEVLVTANKGDSLKNQVTWK